MLIQIHIDINTIKEAIANSDYSMSLHYISDEDIVSAIQAGFQDKYGDLDDEPQMQWLLRKDAVFTKLKVLIAELHNYFWEEYDQLEHQRMIEMNA